MQAHSLFFNAVLKQITNKWQTLTEQAPIMQLFKHVKKSQLHFLCISYFFCNMI